jgi:hypothetical protein
LLTAGAYAILPFYHPEGVDIVFLFLGFFIEFWWLVSHRTKLCDFWSYDFCFMIFGLARLAV